MNEKEFNPLTYAEIKRKLKEPIDKNRLSEKTQGGAKIQFVNITDVKDLLDERIGGNYWEIPKSEIIIANGVLVMTVMLIIHASDGAFAQIGHGNEKLDLKGYGDCSSNAYAQAVRRAAESHGLARELWRQEISAEQWELPATEVQIKTLVEYMKVLGKVEANCAMYYSENRTDLVGELQIVEAARAINELAPKVAAAKKDGGKK